MTPVATMSRPCTPWRNMQTMSPASMIFQFVPMLQRFPVRWTTFLEGEHHLIEPLFRRVLLVVLRAGVPGEKRVAHVRHLAVRDALCVTHSAARRARLFRGIYQICGRSG